PQFHNNLHQLFRIGIEQWYIYPEGFVGSYLTFEDMLPQHLRVHRARAYKPQGSGIRSCRSQSPSTGPDHPCLDNGILDSKKFGDSVLHRNWLESKILTTKISLSTLQGICLLGTRKLA